MTVVKNTNSDYIITSKDGDGNVTINANTQIFGYLDITTDYMTIAAFNNGIINNMGMLAQTSLTSWAGLRFNKTANRWEASAQVNKDGSPISPYIPFGAGTTGNPDGPNLSVQFNNDGVFDGDSNLIYNYPNAELLLNGYQLYGHQVPLTVGNPNQVAVYSNVPNIGNTGLYTSTVAAGGELITANRALLYSIIF